MRGSKRAKPAAFYSNKETYQNHKRTFPSKPNPYPVNSTRMPEFSHSEKPLDLVGGFD
jgi:hypothetical protein